MITLEVKLRKKDLKELIHYGNIAGFMGSLDPMFSPFFEAITKYLKINNLDAQLKKKRRKTKWLNF